MYAVSGFTMGGSRGAVLLFAVFSVCSICVSVSGQALIPAVPAAPVAPPPSTSVTPVRAPVAPVQAPVAPAPVASLAPILAPAPAPSYNFPSCDGVQVVYSLVETTRIFPNATTLAKQPYSFAAAVTLTNEGYSTLESWGVGLTYRHDEVRVLRAIENKCKCLCLWDGYAFQCLILHNCKL